MDVVTMKNPMVSVVMPVYCHSDAHEQFLREALESVARQTYPNIELVLVDDVSPVDIMPIVASVPGLPPTRVLRNAANLRHAGARNVGIRAAEGELIAFLDHDDTWRPEKLGRQVQALQADPDAAMVFCDVEITGSRPEGLYIDQRIIPERPSTLWFVTHNNCVITASSVLVRRQAMLDIGLFDDRYSSCDDFDAWIKIITRWPIVHIPEALANYRLHGANVNTSVDRANDNRLLTDLLLGYWRSAPASERIAMLPVLSRKLAGRALLPLIGLARGRKA